MVCLVKTGSNSDLKKKTIIYYFIYQNVELLKFNASLYCAWQESNIVFQHFDLVP